MTRLTRNAAELAWRRASRFTDLCELAAQFVLGELPLFPGWLAPDLDEESDPLVPHLVAMNRAGFLTLASQPGQPRTPDHGGLPVAQRAFVTGFAEPQTARRLENIGLETDLLVTVHEIDARGGVRIPVGVRMDEPFLWSGYAAGPEELELFAEHLSEAGLTALSACRYVAALDLVWDRRDHLWNHLTRALQKS